MPLPYIGSVTPNSGGSNGRSAGRESPRSHGHHRPHHTVRNVSLNRLIQNSGHCFHIQSTGLQSGLNNIRHFHNKNLFNSGGFNRINSRSSSLLSHTGKGTRKRKCQRTKRRLCHNLAFIKEVFNR